MILGITLFHRDIQQYDEHLVSETFEFGIDEINEEVSSFTVDKYVATKVGDFLLAKYIPSGKFAYFGVIDSQENLKINCKGLLSLAESEIVTVRTSGSNYEEHIHRLIKYYLLDDTTKQLKEFLDVKAESVTAHSYQADESNRRRLNAYITNGFKKYNVKWYFKEIRNRKIYTGIRAVNETIYLKDNSTEFSDWDVFVQSPGPGNENKLLIVDKTMKDIENPTILSTWYIDDENNLTQDGSKLNVTKPTVNLVYIYDQSLEDKPTYEEVAKSELKGNAYSHEIKVNVARNARNIDLRNLETGMLATIIYNKQTYKSVLTAWRVSSEKEFVELTFGNVRSRFMDYFEDYGG
ncbi:hypothetical protein P7D58_17030 [Enterococcus avium]|uniref:hypothetical protein n=1 Tax=Enterococcus avium TaxID=33945 RepID=UPI00288E2CB2|nr:hypothetical protein [Enterococcus avium]MDT2419760.1 hypothetical protein [Enterococcus avium]MDT2432683.1 hypothetical protein [Enterococcus avium]